MEEGEKRAVAYGESDVDPAVFKGLQDRSLFKPLMKQSGRCPLASPGRSAACIQMMLTGDGAAEGGEEAG